MRSSSHQVELIRRYARILRQQAAQHRVPRTRATEKRFSTDTAARAALDVGRPAKPAG